MSSSSSSVVTSDCPSTHHRRTITAAQMDAVGRFDDDDDHDSETRTNNGNVGSKKTKQTPPPSPPSSTPLSSSTSLSGAGIIVEEEEGDEKTETKPSLDVGRPVNMEIGHDEDEDMDNADDFDADLERLLSDGPRSSSGTTTTTTARTRCYNIGGTTVICPRIYHRTGWLGLIGPHWFGPVCTLLLILWGSHHFIVKSNQIGPLTHATCVAFTVMCVVTLIGVSCSDPGIVRNSKPPPMDQGNNWRWCDFCNVYQPPDGQHCPDCKVCVEGYDHHCVWMGTCVGRKNFKAFKLFNLAWLFYLLYCILWVTLFGPKMFHSHDSGSESNGDNEA